MPPVKLVELLSLVESVLVADVVLLAESESARLDEVAELVLAWLYCAHAS